MLASVDGEKRATRMEREPLGMDNSSAQIRSRTHCACFWLRAGRTNGRRDTWSEEPPVAARVEVGKQDTESAKGQRINAKTKMDGVVVVVLLLRTQAVQGVLGVGKAAGNGARIRDQMGAVAERPRGKKTDARLYCCWWIEVVRLRAGRMGRAWYSGWASSTSGHPRSQTLLRDA